MLVVLRAALDQIIVSTVLTAIVGKFGGHTHLSWIVTAYRLATMIVVPLYGMPGDLFSRKIVLQSVGNIISPHERRRHQWILGPPVRENPFKQGLFR